MKKKLCFVTTVPITLKSFVLPLAEYLHATEQFDITVMALFGGGVNEQFLKPHIRLQRVFPKEFPGNSHVMKLLTPKQLHKLFIKERYDIEVSYLEGPSARVISGCPHQDTKLVCWIHVQMGDEKTLSYSFRSPKEARECYNRFDRTACVSAYVKTDFCGILNFERPCEVLYNTVESNQILMMSEESAPELPADNRCKLVAVGTLKKSKGYDRLLNILQRLENAHLYILGIGPMEQQLKADAERMGLQERVTFLGYQTNPYKYVAKCDVFVCASHSEGFSTAATEALIVGTPVCTVEVSGMKEMLGENNEWGIVTENDEEALYQGIKSLLDDPKLLAHYKEKAAQRGKTFSTENTVKAVENMLMRL